MGAVDKLAFSWERPGRDVIRQPYPCMMARIMGFGREEALCPW